MKSFKVMCDGIVKFNKEVGKMLGNPCYDIKEVLGVLRYSGGNSMDLSGDDLIREIARQNAERERQKLEILEEIRCRTLD